MNIELTKEQFRYLLDLVYAGNWVVNSMNSEEDTLEEYNELESYIFSYCKQFGMPEFVERDEETNTDFPTREFEDSGVMDFIDKYDDYTFWDELGCRLAQRDAGLLSKKYGKRQVEELMLEREGQYSEEFEENGLENVEVKGIGKLG